ncbi:MAG: hypothetical protein R3332_12735 [Pseudohongiellaceae bacterium]|nr:hypothetical protein [Pseudohongiellaceae bacterium]
MTIQQITLLLGWTSLINISLLLLTTVAIVTMRSFITRVHAALFGMDEKDLGRAYFQYLAQFKIAILVFNIAPYLALRIIA